MTDRVILSTAPLRGPGLDQLRQLGEVVLDPWIDHQPLRLYNGEQLAERLRSDTVDTFLVHRDLGRE